MRCGGLQKRSALMAADASDAAAVDTILSSAPLPSSHADRCAASGGWHWYSEWHGAPPAARERRGDDDDPGRNGKWLLFGGLAPATDRAVQGGRTVPEGCTQLDVTWVRVAAATAAGRIPACCEAKCSAGVEPGERSGVICVYNDDYTYVKSVAESGAAIAALLGLQAKTRLPYKTDE